MISQVVLLNEAVNLQVNCLLGPLTTLTTQRGNDLREIVIFNGHPSCTTPDTPDITALRDGSGRLIHPFRATLQPGLNLSAYLRVKWMVDIGTHFQVCLYLCLFIMPLLIQGVVTQKNCQWFVVSHNEEEVMAVYSKILSLPKAPCYG